MTSQISLMILCWIFIVSVDLTLKVYSIAIKNIKMNGLPEKSMNFEVDSLIEKNRRLGQSRRREVMMPLRVN